MSLATGMPVTAGQQLEHSPAILELGNKSTEDSGEATPRPEERPEKHIEDDSKDAKKKRSLFGFGKKREEATASKNRSSMAGSTSAARPVPLQSESSKLSSTTHSTSSPTRSEHQPFMPASPGRNLTGSPRVASPAGSQIFERDVDTVTALTSQSPAIPSHIQTENHIPPVLDASSEAITDERLNPDSVEIVTHAQHQPASVAVTGGVSQASAQQSYEQLAASWAEDLSSFADRETDNASNYGSLDAADVRRLSFISFADVVQAEHTGGSAAAASRDSMHLAGLTSLSANRSPSPIRSPVSSQEGPGTSPPTSSPGSIKGVELSPVRKPIGGAGSPISSHHPTSTGDINIETMSQALRRTGSTDFGASRSFPVSPVEGPSR